MEIVCELATDRGYNAPTSRVMRFVASRPYFIHAAVCEYEKEGNVEGARQRKDKGSKVVAFAFYPMSVAIETNEERSDHCLAKQQVAR